MGEGYNFLKDKTENYAQTDFINLNLDALLVFDPTQDISGGLRSRSNEWRRGLESL